LLLKPAPGHALTFTYDQFHHLTDTKVLTSLGSSPFTGTTTGFLANDSNRRARTSLEYRYLSPDAASGLIGGSVQVYQQSLDSHEKTVSQLISRSQPLTRYDDNSFTERSKGVEGQLNWHYTRGELSQNIIAGA